MDSGVQPRSRQTDDRSARLILPQSKDSFSRRPRGLGFRQYRSEFIRWDRPRFLHHAFDRIAFCFFFPGFLGLFPVFVLDELLQPLLLLREQLFVQTFQQETLCLCYGHATYLP